MNTDYDYEEYGGANVAKHLKKLIDANRSLADMESLEALFPRLLEIAKDVTDSETSSLLLYHAERNVLSFVSVADDIVGEKGGEILKSSVELKVGEGLSQNALQSCLQVASAVVNTHEHRDSWHIRIRIHPIN